MSVLSAEFYLEGKRGLVFARWLADACYAGLGVPDRLQRKLVESGLPGCFAPADLDSWLLAFEARGLIQRVKWYPTFSRRAFLGSFDAGSQYPFDFNWEVPKGKGRELFGILDKAHPGCVFAL